MMVRKKEASFRRHSLLGQTILTFIVTLFIAFCGYIIVIKTQKRPVVESPKTEMKKLPEHLETRSRQNPLTTKIHIPILMYHYVENVTDTRDTIRQSLNVRPHIFEEQLKTLQTAGYTFMTAREVADVLDGAMQLPKKPIVLTFDDGHKDVYSVIVPLLRQYQAKGTVYVITDFLEGSDFMTEEELNAVIASGVMEIGAHTVHHVSLQNKIETVVRDEVRGSKEWLEDRYHISIVSFAYPNGAFDDQAASIVEETGFTNAVSTIPGSEVSQSNRFFLYRLRPGYRTGDDLLNYIAPPKENVGATTSSP